MGFRIFADEEQPPILVSPTPQTHLSPERPVPPDAPDAAQAMRLLSYTS